MTRTGKLVSLLGAACLVALAGAAPAQAAKPCCYNNGDYYQASPSTCYRYGGRVVDLSYCYRGGRYSQRGYGPSYDDGYGYGPSGPSFAIAIGDIVIAYSDGYYDRHRRWHRWNNHRQRDWFRRHHSRRYHGVRRDRDRDRHRRDWRDGRRDRWD